MKRTPPEKTADSYYIQDRKWIGCINFFTTFCYAIRFAYDFIDNQRPVLAVWLLSAPALQIYAIHNFWGRMVPFVFAFEFICFLRRMSFLRTLVLVHCGTNIVIGFLTLPFLGDFQKLESGKFERATQNFFIKITYIDEAILGLILSAFVFGYFYYSERVRKTLTNDWTWSK